MEFTYLHAMVMDGGSNLMQFFNLVGFLEYRTPFVLVVAFFRC